jgi:YHS domain-containing protein
MTTPARTVAILCIAAASFVAGLRWSRSGGSAQPAPGGRKILYYHDPMHPAYKSDKPGIAPDCGMQLEPVYADGEGPAAAPSGMPPAPPGSVRIDAEKRRQIGVRVEEVRKAGHEVAVRILGRVVVDEARLYKINSGADGLIRETSPATTGSLVKKDEVLASYFTADSVTYRSQQGFLNLLNVTGDPAMADFARDSLKLAGLSDEQVRELAKTRKLNSTYRIVSPADGFILARNVSPGQRFDKGFEFYRIADLSSVWVVASVFENDARLLRSITGASVRHLGRVYPARMSAVLPEFDPATRALKVRFEVANPGFELRPDMFADIEFKAHVPSAIMVPAGAVLDSGLRKTVFVDRGDGYLEPREVETGVRSGDDVVITKGLAPGERIVVSGNFLVDSESRFQLAAQPPPSAKDPVCGMDVNPASPHTAMYGGKMYRFCSADCLRKFNADPGKYAGGKSQ